jgi:hypothetical protein
MALIGTHLPAGLVRPRIEAALQPGCVIKLLVKFPQITKQKFLVLVANDDPEYLTFIINSEIHPFIANRQTLLQCQVGMDAASHDFLSYDSHLACHEVLPIKREEVIQALMNDPTGIQGAVSFKVREQIVAAVKFAKTINQDHKDRILSALSND